MDIKTKNPMPCLKSQEQNAGCQNNVLRLPRTTHQGRGKPVACAPTPAPALATKERKPGLGPQPGA